MTLCDSACYRPDVTHEWLGVRMMCAHEVSRASACSGTRLCAGGPGVRAVGGVVVVALVLGLLVVIPPAPASAQVGQMPFNCVDPAGYLIQGAAGADTSEAVRVSLANGEHTVVAPDLFAEPTNAWGYNPTDDYIWGRPVDTGTDNRLLRVGADWSVEEFAFIGAPIAADYSGDVSSSGVLHLGTASATRIYRIDVNPASDDYLHQLAPVTLRRSVNIADWVFSSVDGMLYAIESNRMLVRIHPTTGTVTNLGTMTAASGPQPPTGLYGGGFMDVDGNLYLSHNPTGQIWVVEAPHTGNTSATLLSTGDTSSFNDGARCPTAPSVLEPGISVVKTSDFDDDEIIAGDVITYTIIAYNAGNTVLDDVTVTDDLLDDLVCDPGTPATLAEGESVTCTGTYEVTPADAAVGQLVNTATATGLDPDGTLVDGSDTEFVPAEVPAPAIELVKEANTTGPVEVGDEIGYTLTVTNTGNVSLTQVTVDDALLGVMECIPVMPAGLAPGGTKACEDAYTVTQADVDAGEVVNVAVATGIDRAGTEVSDADEVTVPTVGPDPELTVVKVADTAGPVDVGDEIGYTITVTNTGNVTLTGVVVDDPLLFDLVCDPDAPASVMPTEVITCTGIHTVIPEEILDGQVVNTAAATGVDPNATEVSDDDDVTVPTVGPDPELTVVKVADTAGPVDVGDEITYTITATNAGNVTLTEVVVDDPLLPDLDCDPATPSVVGPGDVIECTGVYMVTQADEDVGTVDNTAVATGIDHAGMEVSDADEVIVPTVAAEAALAVVKAADTAGPVDVGDEIGYTVTATNAGNVTLTDVTVDDPRIPDLDCDPTVPAVVAPGGVVVCTGSLTVTAADADVGAVINTVTVTGADPGGDATTGTDDETVDVAPSDDPPGDPPGPPDPPDPPDPPEDPEDPDDGEVIRIDGDDRIETAIEISNDSFGDGDAAVVILARDDIYADALTGTPLGVRENGPILLTRTTTLLPVVVDEIRRVLGDHGRVYLLGGEDALDANVWEETAALGYPQQRLSGPTRVETAIEISTYLGHPDLMMIARGWEFPDALTAAAAAGANEGAVLLTGDGEPHPSVDTYLADLDPDLYAIGGPAAAAYPDVEPVVGATRDLTAVQVAETFFGQPAQIGVARLDDFPDALTGGRHIAALGGPLLLTTTAVLPEPTADYICGLDALDRIYVYGGEAAVSGGVVDELTRLVTGGCPGP